MKYLISFILILLLAASAFAWDTLWQEKQQRELAFEARAVLQDGTNVLLETISRLDAIKAQASFDTLPADKKQTLNDWLQIFKDARTALNANADIKAAYEWAPPR